MFHRFGGVQKRVRVEGTHLMVPWFQRPIIFDVRAKPRMIQAMTGSQDLQMVSITLRVLSRPSVAHLPQIYRELGTDYDERVLPSIVNETLKDLKKYYPAYDGQGYELAGFGWHQGWNDGGSMDFVQAYEENLSTIIKDLRKEWKVPDLPVVIGVSGFGGRNQSVDRRLGIIAAQHAVANRREFKGSVASVETRDFFRPAEQSPSRQGYHWNGNAETFYLIGEGMGQAMVRLLKK